VLTVSGNNTYVMQGDSRSRALDKFHLIFAPSYGCNLTCKHCYLQSHANNGMDFSTVKQVFTEWSDIVKSEKGSMNGIFHLKGGEPLALPYLCDVFDLLKKQKSCSLMITTNGTLGNDHLYAELLDLDSELNKSTVVIVSLDGSQDEIHGLLRGEGNFSKSIDFIKNLICRDITVHVNYVIHKKNLDDLEKFIDMAKSLGVSQINFLKFIPKGFGESIEEWAVDNSLFNQRMIDLYENASSEVKVMLSGNLGYIIDQEKNGKCTSCECVGGYKGILYILPNGDVFSCPNLIEPKLQLGNINSESLHTLHDNAVNRIYEMISSFSTPMYLCKGEKLPEITIPTEHQSDNYANGVSYCFSRNF